MRAAMDDYKRVYELDATAVDLRPLVEQTRTELSKEVPWTKPDPICRDMLIGR